MHRTFSGFLSISVALLTFSLQVHASVVQPDDGPYYRLRRGPILYVYDESTREAVPQIAGYMQAIRANYDKSFNWRLDEEEDLILTSDNNQIANAYATVSPNMKSVWYPGGPIMLEQMAESSWFLTLATHETSHLYQLNAKTDFGSGMKSVFGNSQVLVFGVIPFFIQPNQFLPTFLVEGNAVLNESRANLGGRLHSGEVRALVLAEIKAGYVTPKRLINDEFKFPFGQYPYIQGGYFQAHLAAKYGVDKTNQFFNAQSEHNIVPLILNKTFRDHFGNSYPQEIHEYVREMEGLANKQQTTNGQTIENALYISPLNRIGDTIYFVSNRGVETNVLFKLKDGQAVPVTEQMDLPLGKVFMVDGQPETAASEQHDLHHIEYSLYGEDQAFDPKYGNQIVTDRRAGKTVALDAHNVWLENHVLVNGEVYDVAHSLPILDDQGDVYYFRQDGNERVLYKNRQPVFKYDGFYGKLMEVGPDGSIYFIANTDYGSTLYKYKDREITRVLPSDTVVDARRIDETHFVVVEVYADGHKVMFAEASPRSAVPANFSYGFPSYNLLPDKIEDKEQVKTDERSYNSLGQLRYSNLDFNSGWSSNSGLNLGLSANFIDPIEYSHWNLAAVGSTNSTKAVAAGYSYTRYLLQPTFQYVYQDQYWHQFNGATRQALGQQARLGVNIPLLRWEHWDAGWNISGLYNRSDNQLDPSAPTPPKDTNLINETYGAYNSVTLAYAVTADPNIGFYPWRSFTLNYQNKLESAPGSFAKKYNTSFVQAQYQRGFPHQFYGSLSGSAAWAENHDVNVGVFWYPLTADIRMPRLVDHNPYVVKTASSARFEATKVFDVPGYLTRFPISVERIAPLVIAQGMFFDNDGVGNGGYPGSLFEWGWGADIQLLLGHLIATKLRLLSAYDTTTPVHAKTGDNQAMLTTTYSF